MSTAGLRRRIDRLEDLQVATAPVVESPEAVAARAALQRWLDFLIDLDSEDSEARRFPPASWIAYQLAVAFDGYGGPVRVAEEVWEEFREKRELETVRLLWERMGPDWPVEWPRPPLC